MKRNIFLISAILFFWLGLYLIYNHVSIIDKAPFAKKTYMFNKKKTINRVKQFHEKSKEDYIFAKMMANNKDGLINAVLKNHPKFWVMNNKAGVYEGFNTKFDKLIQNIIKDNNIDIIIKISRKVGDKRRMADNIEQSFYELVFDCEYEALIAFITALEKNDRIYNIHELKINNNFQKNIQGINVIMKLFEINIGKK